MVVVQVKERSGTRSEEIISHKERFRRLFGNGTETAGGQSGINRDFSELFLLFFFACVIRWDQKYLLG